MPQAFLIIPCYNEALRLPARELLELARQPDLHLLFVDDGSTDTTCQRLEALAAESAGRAEVLKLPRNAGKGEAVRAGLCEALARGAELVGFADADLSTPVAELQRLLEEARRRSEKVVLASRVRLLGTQVERQTVRHLCGRVFATVAALALDMPVYDTQCGAKFFRDTPALREALATPFTSRWAFDVELFARLLTSRPDAYRPEDFVEVPLRVWRDVGGSTLRPGAALRAGLDLFAIGYRKRQARASRGGQPS